MRFINFLEEKIIYIIFQITYLFTIFLFLKILNVNIYIIILFIFILIIYNIIYLTITYHKELKEYRKIIKLVDEIEEKYLISTIINKPTNIENKAYYYALKQACKAMNDKIDNLENKHRDFQEYIESFVHEIKNPISALSLTFDNNKDEDSKEEIDKIENLIDQMLYYARVENVEKDYFVKEIKINDLIHPIILNYKKYLLKRKITLNIHDIETIVYTDYKWLTFILNQIIQNSIKYLDKKEKEIEIYSKDNKNNVILTIIDNGCGIKESELPRIFEKGFTGSNRKKEYATGMGLYLAKKLTDKMNIKLQITSCEAKYTKVDLIFPKSNIYKIK